MNDDQDPIQAAEAEGPEAVRALIQGAAGGDPLLQRALYDHLLPTVRRAVRARLGQRFGEDVVEEAIQVAMIALWEALPSFQGCNKEGVRSSLRTWAGGVARFQALSAVRSPRAKPIPLGDPTRIEAEAGATGSPEDGHLDLEAIFAASLSLEHLNRALQVGPWAAGGAAPEPLSEGELTLLLDHFGEGRCLKSWAREEGIPLDALLETRGHIRARALAAVGDHEGWATFDPAMPQCQAEGLRLLARLLVYLIPAARFRTPGKFRLSANQRARFELEFGPEDLRVEEIARRMGVKRGYADQLLYEVRQKALLARDYIDAQLGEGGG